MAYSLSNEVRSYLLKLQGPSSVGDGKQEPSVQEPNLLGISMLLLCHIR